MKKHILLSSAISAVVATVLGLLAAYGQGDTNTYHHVSAATCVGLLSLSLLLIGTAFPKEV